MQKLAWRGLTALVVALCGSPVAAQGRSVVNGLKTEIFAGQNFDRRVAERIDPNIASFWDDGTPHDDAPLDYFSVKWSGWIRAPKAGRYKLVVISNDGMRLWINGQRVIDEWRNAVGTFEASVELTEDPVTIQLDYYEVTVTAWCVLMWQPTGVAQPAVVPTEYLFPDEQSAKARPGKAGLDKRGLTAEYFDRKFSRKLRSERVYRTEAIWGTGGPMWGMPKGVGARYTGVLVPPVTGQYKMIGWANEKMAVWIDGKPLLDVSEARAKHETAFTELEAGVAYPIRIEFVDSPKWGSFYLHWVPPGGNKELSIPTECLFQNKAAVPKS